MSERDASAADVPGHYAPDASRRWPSIAAFAAGGSWEDGVHAIRIGTSELHVSLQDAALEGDHAVLPVLFTHTLAEQDARTAFPGTRAGDRPMPAIRIADPGCLLDGALQDSWYVGSAHEPLQPLLTELLRAIAARTGKELLLVGGYGGGFAALYHAHVLGPLASALVWNPHTDWLECQESVVRRFLAQAFPDIALPEEGGPPFRQAMAEVLRARGIVHALSDVVGTGTPRRLLVLQGASDPHLVKQTVPFMEAAGFGAVEEGFAATRHALLWFGGWTPGRAAPPSDVLASALAYLRDPAAPVAGFRKAIERDGFVRYVKPALAPRDLRGEHLPLKVSAVADAGLLRVQAQVGELPEGHGQVAYAFYVHSGRERVATRWYETGQTFLHHDDPAKPATRVVAFARDGLGHPLQTRDVSVCHADQARRVLIFGSCVSRDAFALSQHDLVLAAYIARSSLASAFGASKPSLGIGAYLENIESEFQRKAVARDFARSAAAIMRSTACEMVLLDLIDERFALLDVSGALVTISNELKATGFPIRGRIVESGSPEHQEFWRRGLDAFVAAVGKRPLVVNRVRWASHDQHGAPLADQARILRANATLSEMYARLAEVPGVRFIDYPDALLVADREHKWGVSPFHYVQGMYDHTMRELERMLPSPDAPSPSRHRNTQAR